MVRTSCLCGGVEIGIASAPAFVHDCNCQLCRNSGAAWGYFSTSEVVTSGLTVIVVRPDREEPAVAIHACGSCHATTHWTLTEAFLAKTPEADRMGVNMRLFPSEVLDGVEIRYPDGAGWTGEGDFGFRRPSFTASRAVKF